MAPAGEDRHAGNRRDKRERCNESTELLEFQACPVSAVSRGARQRLCTPAHPMWKEISRAISDLFSFGPLGIPIRLQKEDEAGSWVGSKTQAQLETSSGHLFEVGVFVVSQLVHRIGEVQTRKRRSSRRKPSCPHSLS